MRIGESELVLAKMSTLHQVLVDGVEQYQAGMRWNIIVYDRILGSVTASLTFAE